MDLMVLILCAYLTWGLKLALRFITKNAKPDAFNDNPPPGPPPLPLIGNLLELGNLPHKSFAKLARAYGPILKLQLGSVTTIIVSSPVLAQEILQTHDASFCNRAVPNSVAPYCQGELGLPWMPVSPLWRNLRRICNLHVFAKKKLDSTQCLRRKAGQELVAHVEKCARTGDAVDIREVAFQTSLNFLSKTIFSSDLIDNSSVSVKELKEIFRQIVYEAGKPNVADFFPLLKKIDPQGARHRMEVYFEQMFDLFDIAIQKRLQLRATPSFPRMNDVLDTLLDMREDNNERMDILLMKHLFLDLLVAGTDTTSSTLEWAMAELLHIPSKLLKAQAELDQVIGRGKPIAESDVARLPYLQAIIKETFRLHPPVPLLLPRKSEVESQIQGFTIPKGAQIFVNIWAMGRDAALWKDSDVFSPERFLGSEVDVKGQSFKLIPFGGGRRICPGLPLALRMLDMMLGTLLNCFNWKLEGGIEPVDINMDDKYGLTIQKDQPLRAVLTLA